MGAVRRISYRLLGALNAWPEILFLVSGLVIVVHCIRRLA